MTQWRLLIVLQPIVIYCYNLRNHIQLTLRNSAWVGFQPGTLVVFELLGADSNHSAIHLRFMPKVSSEQFDLISLITVVLKQTFNWSCFSPNVYFAWTQQKVNWIFFPSSLRKIWLTFSQEKKHPPPLWDGMGKISNFNENVSDLFAQNKLSVFNFWKIPT